MGGLTHAHSVAYTGADYEEVRQDGGRAVSASSAHPAGLADVPLEAEGEKIAWEARPPAQVLYHDYARWDHPQVRARHLV